MKFEITIEATNEEDAVFALEEAAKWIAEGYLSGFNSNEDSSYHFERIED